MLFGVPVRVIKYFAVTGIKTYFFTYAPAVIAVFAVFLLMKFFGLLNLGNLPMNSKAKKKTSSLNGKNLIFLGSSVTRGMAAQGKSFVDLLAASTGAKTAKEAVSGTTLVEEGGKNYIARLKKLDKTLPCDIFICQLSTNDATKKKPLGTISASKDLASFDTKTVCGAIEYIIAYAKQTWNCPVVFYTNPQYASPAYAAMVDALNQISEKWNISVIDLWNDAEINEKQNKTHTCMNDQIHPTRKGYAVWTPVIVNALEDVAAGKPVAARSKNEVSVEAVKKAHTKATLVKLLKATLTVILMVVVSCGAAGFRTLDDSTGLTRSGNKSVYDPANQTELSESPIKDKKILCLGSSVTVGMAARNNSFAEYLAAVDGAEIIKDAISGTTVTTSDDVSFWPRLQKYTADDNIDIVILQLSSNDATMGSSLGSFTDSFDPSTFNTEEFCGSLETIIAYTENTLGAEFVIFTNPVFGEGPTYKPAAYANLVDVTNDIIEKWDAHIIDLWNDEEFNDISADLHEEYMTDDVHPTKRGYLEWWLPEFQEVLYSICE